MLKQKDWIEILVKKLGCTKKDAKEYYDCVFDYVREQISPTEAVKISSFGVFKLRKTMAKEQINLVTGMAEIVPEHYVITFKPYFEIEPKPEAIVIADTEEVNPIETPEVVNEEVIEEEVVVEEETAEETPVEEEVAVEEEAVEEKVEETTTDDLEWVYEGNTYTTKDIRKVLIVKTNLSEVDVDASLDVIIENVKKLGSNKTVRITEDKAKFNFEFDK